MSVLRGRRADGSATWLHCSWLSWLAETRSSRTKPREVDQPGAAREVPAGAEPRRTVPGPCRRRARATRRRADGRPDSRGAGNAGGGGEADGAESAPTENAETRSRRAFFGRSGHLAVMSEFLHRRINVAIPEVDVGDDVFVVKGSDDTVTRVQVKAATAKAQVDGYFAVFNVPLAQLSVPRDTPALVYVFATRFQNRWSDFIVIRRSTLFARVNEGAGSRRVPPTVRSTSSSGSFSPQMPRSAVRSTSNATATPGIRGRRSSLKRKMLQHSSGQHRRCGAARRYPPAKVGKAATPDRPTPPTPSSG